MWHQVGDSISATVSPVKTASTWFSDETWYTVIRSRLLLQNSRLFSRDSGRKSVHLSHLTMSFVFVISHCGLVPIRAADFLFPPHGESLSSLIPFTLSLCCTKWPCRTHPQFLALSIVPLCCLNTEMETSCWAQLSRVDPPIQLRHQNCSPLPGEKRRLLQYGFRG